MINQMPNSLYYGTYIYYKYSTLPRGISVFIAPKVGIFLEAGGLRKYSLPDIYFIAYDIITYHFNLRILLYP